MRIYRGILTSIEATHYEYRQFRRMRRNRYAKVSLWGEVEGSRGGIYDVWLGKAWGMPGVPVERQEQRVLDATSHFIGKEIKFVCRRYRGQYTYFITGSLLN